MPILASAGNYSVRLSDPRPTQRADILSLSLHKPGKEVEAVSISPDGSVLVSGGRDGQLILINLHVPSVVPRTDTRTTTSATVRQSCEILELSQRMRSASDPLDTPSEGSTTELENLRAIPEAKDELTIIQRKETRRSLHISERKHSDIAAGVILRRAHDKRIKDKLVDIPTMIAHLSARASMIIEDPSSSDTDSGCSESDDDSADSEDYNESQFLANVSETSNQFTKKESIVPESDAKCDHTPPPRQGLPLLPDEAVEKVKENRSTLEKREEEKKRRTSLVNDDTMDSVVFLMKNYLDENKPTLGQSGQDCCHQTVGHGNEISAEGGEAESQDSHISCSESEGDESHHNVSGQYSLSPERPVSDFDQELRTDSELSRQQISRQSAMSMDDKRSNSLTRGSSASGNEYGDEVPLSMI